MHALTRREVLTGMGGLAAVLFSGCAANPVTGRREFMLMTESQEIALGQEGHADIIASYGVFDNTSVQDWFSVRGHEMGAVTHRPGLPYNFTVLDSPVVNAFALPGGYVYVTRGILGYFNDEAQFAGVLGHELGHVNARHSAQRYSKAQLANLTLGIGSVFSEEFAKYAQYASVGMSLLFLKFSRDDEREADQLGVEYSSKVHFDAVRMSDFFVTLERMRPEGGSLPEWQSTHPDPGNRIAATRDGALKFQKNNPGEYLRRRNEYLELIDGLPFGENPRQGFVDSGVFYHPELTLQFPVPGGWTVTNTPAEVRLAPEDQQAVMIFTLADGSDPQTAAMEFAKNAGMTIASQNTAAAGSMSGYRIVGTLTSNDQELAVTSHFIAKDNRVFVFHGITDPANMTAYTTVFGSIVNGFMNLTDRSRLDVQPERIEVRAVDRNVLLSKAFSDFGVPEDRTGDLAIVNGLELHNLLEAGTRIKIIA